MLENEIFKQDSSDEQPQTKNDIKSERHAGKDIAQHQAEITLSQENLARLQALGVISSIDREEKIKEVIESGRKKAS